MAARTVSGKPNAAIDPPWAWREWTEGEILGNEASMLIGGSMAATTRP
jgi:hypothetical protein